MFPFILLNTSLCGAAVTALLLGWKDQLKIHLTLTRFVSGLLLRHITTVLLLCGRIPPPAPDPTSGCLIGVKLGPNEEDGDEPHPGGDGANRPLRGPAARYQRATEEDGRVRGEELPTELHPERAVLHRPARPTGLHHGGGQRRPLLQPSRHRGDSADGSCKWGKKGGDIWGFT